MIENAEHKCIVCGKEEKTSQWLDEHMRLAHRRCQRCGAKLSEAVVNKEDDSSAFTVREFGDLCLSCLNDWDALQQRIVWLKLQFMAEGRR